MSNGLNLDSNQPQGGQEQTQGGTTNPFGVPTDAVTALNTAINGVNLLSQAVTHIQMAIGRIDASVVQGRNYLLNYTDTVLKARLESYANERLPMSPMPKTQTQSDIENPPSKDLGD